MYKEIKATIIESSKAEHNTVNNSWKGFVLSSS